MPSARIAPGGTRSAARIAARPVAAGGSSIPAAGSPTRPAGARAARAAVAHQLGGEHHGLRRAIAAAQRPEQRPSPAAGAASRAPAARTGCRDAAAPARRARSPRCSRWRRCTRRRGRRASRRRSSDAATTGRRHGAVLRLQRPAVQQQEGDCHAVMRLQRAADPQQQRLRAVPQPVMADQQDAGRAPAPAARPPRGRWRSGRRRPSARPAPAWRPPPTRSRR